MTSFLWILLLASLVATTIAQDFDLADAFDIDTPPTKTPVKPAPPKNSSPDDFDLGDAFDLDDPEKPAVNPPKEDPKKPTGDGFDLSDALGPDTEPKKPVVKPPKEGGTGTGGGNFDDKDLFETMDGDDGYKPDGGKSGGRAADSEHEGGASDQPQGAGALAGIISSVGVALIGAASGYIAYQKKKLCFKIQGGQDPESGKTQHGGTSDNQVFSNLLNSS